MEGAFANRNDDGEIQMLDCPGGSMVLRLRGGHI